MRAESKEVGLVRYRRELDAAEELYRDESAELGKIEADRLDKAGEVGDDEDLFVLECAKEDEDLAVLRMEKLDRAAAEGAVAPAQGDEPAHPPEEGMRVL